MPGLDDRGEALERGVREEGGEPVAEQSLAESGVAVPVGAERRRGVVDVQAAKAVEPDPPIELVQRLVERRPIDDVDAGRVPVAGVEAEAERSVTGERVEEGLQLGRRAAHRAAGAGGVLEQEPGSVAASLQQLAQHGHGALDARVEAGAQVRADVEDDSLGLDRARRLHGGLHRRAGLRIHVVVERAEVDEVDGVTHDRLDSRFRAALAEPCERLLFVRGRAPHPRALGEHLHRLARHLGRPVDRLVDPSFGRDVSAEEHRGTVSAGVSPASRSARRARRA